jgi:hypothetical protein
LWRCSPASSAQRAPVHLAVTINIAAPEPQTGMQAALSATANTSLGVAQMRSGRRSLRRPRGGGLGWGWPGMRRSSPASASSSDNSFIHRRHGDRRISGRAQALAHAAGLAATVETSARICAPELRRPPRALPGERVGPAVGHGVDLVAAEGARSGVAGPVRSVGRRYRYRRLAGADQDVGGALTEGHDGGLPSRSCEVSRVPGGWPGISRHVGCCGLSATALSQRSCSPASRRCSTSAATWE